MAGTSIARSTLWPARRLSPRQHPRLHNHMHLTTSPQLWSSRSEFDARLRGSHEERFSSDLLEEAINWSSVSNVPPVDMPSLPHDSTPLMPSRSTRSPSSRPLPWTSSMGAALTDLDRCRHGGAAWQAASDATPTQVLRIPQHCVARHIARHAHLSCTVSYEVTRHHGVPSANGASIASRGTMIGNSEYG